MNVRDHVWISALMQAGIEKATLKEALDYVLDEDCNQYRRRRAEQYEDAMAEYTPHRTKPVKLA
jgi:hypothetical protein